MSAPRTRAQLLAAVQRDEQAWRRALVDLRGAVRHRLDVRSRIRTHPARWVASALLLGAWLGQRKR